MESIKLAEEMAVFTNKIVNKGRKPPKRHKVKDVELINIKEARVNINKYPSLAEYTLEKRHCVVLMAQSMEILLLNPKGTNDPRPFVVQWIIQYLVVQQLVDNTRAIRQ